MRPVKPGNVLIVSEHECKQVLTPERVLALTEQALADYSGGTAINPVKLHLPLYPENNGWINSMPSWLKRQNVVGCKWINVHGDNPRLHNLPTVVGVCVLNDPATGIPYAIVDGTYVTAMRTGACAAIQAKYMGKKDAKIMTIVGAGVQGNTTMTMAGLLLPSIQEVRVMDIRPEATDRLIENAKKQYPEKTYRAYSDLAAACAGSDIVFIAAHGMESVLIDTIELHKGLTVVGIGQWLTPEQRPKFDRVIFDFIDCVVHRANQAGQYTKDLYGTPFTTMERSIADGEIGDVITGKAVGRANDDEIIFSFGVGMSIEDIAVAYEAYEKAAEAGLGTEVNLFDVAP